MKRIFAIIIAMATLAACGPEEAKNLFTADKLPGTKWDGTLKEMEGKVVKSTSEVTIRFNTASEGQLTHKDKGAAGKETYQMSYSVSGQNISVDCPIINGTWAVSNYTDQSMTLTILPGKNKTMSLMLQ